MLHSFFSLSCCMQSGKHVYSALVFYLAAVALVVAVGAINNVYKV